MAKKTTPKTTRGKKGPPALALGALARDKVSGFTGMLVARFEYMTGNTQFMLQPAMKKGETKIPATEVFHAHALEYAGPGIAADVPEATDFANLRLGERAKDRASGLVGIVTVRATFHSGCTSYQLQPAVSADAMKQHELPESFLFGSERLEKVDSGIAESLPTPDAPAMVGGPFVIARSA